MAKKGKKKWLPMVIGLAALVLMVPITLKLAQQNQENRSQAGIGGDAVRTLCKAVCTVNLPHLITNKTEACYKVCDGIVLSCGTLASIDNVRSGVCYKECKVVLAGYSAITENNVDSDCQNFCKQIISPMANLLKCTDDKCTQLRGECVAPLSASEGSSCVLSDGRKGKVQSNKCLSQASMNKKCCVPNSSIVSPTPTKKVTTCSAVGGYCIAGARGVTTGIKCTVSSSVTRTVTRTGTLNLSYSCPIAGNVCCKL